ncbi:ArsC/Spx/MgsR family protein [Methylomonas sp. AM2-LC]|uniref:ArsC/Spx/MgsR family protein n=1 Tax=Methylomonas sp. AM2-LC TaxID=3153301 RepID=UPI003264D7E6
MATIHFYEKPGCTNNTRQKQLLIKAGHVLVIHNLLTQNWGQEPEKLRSFFGTMPVADWFNLSAPAIKNGEIIPEAIAQEQAIALMIANPLLIRRPLLEVDEQRLAGFDPTLMASKLGLSMTNAGTELETCPNTHQHKSACLP